jgi:hypothetical protein
MTKRQRPDGEETQAAEAAQAEPAPPDTKAPDEHVQKPRCGIVMPISAIDGCPASHWEDVFEIIAAAAQEAGFNPRLVSTSEEVGIIQGRIIQNLYTDPVIVCDVSARNPNVMFELGLRLAFDKPTIIIKDDQTPYSFDTSPIEHLGYPRDMRYGTMVKFLSDLAARIRATYNRATSDPNYTTFLKHFGDFKVATLETKEVNAMEYIMQELGDIKASMQTLQAIVGQPSASQGPLTALLHSTSRRLKNRIVLGIPESFSSFDPDALLQMLNKNNIPVTSMTHGGGRLDISLDPDASPILYEKARSIASNFIARYRE